MLRPNAIPTLLRMRGRLRACCGPLADFVARTVAALPTPPGETASDAHLDELLTETSRTFAVCIPLLHDSTRLQVTIAYLLFRIADTFEDASHWPVADRLAALEEFCALLRNGDAAEGHHLAATWHARNPSPHAGYMRLI